MSGAGADSGAYASAYGGTNKHQEAYDGADVGADVESDTFAYSPLCGISGSSDIGADEQRSEHIDCVRISLVEHRGRV